MKNLILVINKEKVYAYVVSVFTILTLFLMSTLMKDDIDSTEETKADIYNNNVQTNNITNQSYINIT